MECGQGAYIDLMKQYPRVVAVFLGLEERYQKVMRFQRLGISADSGCWRMAGHLRARLRCLSATKVDGLIPAPSHIAFRVSGGNLTRLRRLSAKLCVW